MKTNQSLARRTHVGSLALAVAFLTQSPQATAASLLLNADGGWNGFFVMAEVESGFRPAGSPSGSGEFSSFDYGFLIVAPDTVVANETLTLVSTLSDAPLAITFSPDSGLPKDISTGSFAFTFTVGTLTTPDSFNISFASTTSAEAAQMDFGSGLENADAFFRAKISLRSAFPVTMPGASIRVPDLPALSDPLSESFGASFKFFQSGTPVFGFTAPGDSGMTLPLELTSFGEDFSYELNYEITTPFGTDPTYEYSFTGGAQIPEPATSAFAALSLLSLAVRRRR